MCDCYRDLCRICGAPVPMHLGDYDTMRLEVAVVCEACMEKTEAKGFPVMDYHLHKFRRCIWADETKRFPRVMVIALTANAWKNRKKNHPDVNTPKLVREIDPK